MTSRCGQPACTPTTAARAVALALLLSVPGLAGCQLGRGELAGRGSDQWTRTYALQDAITAHRDAEAAQHAGPVVLLP